MITGDSLSAFSRVRLYTAIYPEGDVADFTESFFCNDVGLRTISPVLSLRDLSLKRLPSVNPLRYQSPIALVLGAKLHLSPMAIAQAICQGSVAIDDVAIDDVAMDGLELSWNELGWITVTWESGAMTRALARLCAGLQAEGLQAESLQAGGLQAGVPFWLWQVGDRVRSLRDQLRSLHPEFEPSSNVSTAGMPDPVWELLEAMVVFFDRRSEGKSGKLEGEIRSLCHAFEQMHRQIPLFSVETSVIDRYTVWLVLGWFQQILKLG